MHRRSLTALGTSPRLLSLFGLAPAESQGRGGETPASGRARRGLTVWYGDARHERTMANGRPFDYAAMTAASRRFALGTRVRVTGLETRRRVTVTVTDYTIPNSRVLIDFSRGAARALGIETRGRARVEVVPVGFDRGGALQRRRT